MKRTIIAAAALALMLAGPAVGLTVKDSGQLFEWNRQGVIKTGTACLVAARRG